MRVETDTEIARDIDTEPEMETETKIENDAIEVPPSRRRGLQITQTNEMHLSS